MSRPAHLTDERIAAIITSFNRGENVRNIAKQNVVTEDVIRDILKTHRVSKALRKEKLTTNLTNAQEEALVRHIVKANYVGGYVGFRQLVEKWASEHRWACSFQYSWRRAFLKRHGARFSEHIRNLLSTRPRDEYAELIPGQDVEEEIVDEEPVEDMTVEWRIVTEEPTETTFVPLPLSEEVAISEPSLPVSHIEHVEVELTEDERRDLADAIELAMQAFSKAGVTDERARLLLRNMDVPGFGGPVPPRKRNPNKRKKLDETKDRWRAKAAAILDGPKPPLKKTPLQLRVLEREYVKNNHINVTQAMALGKKISLPTDTVLAWFRNRRQKKSAKKH